MVLKMVWRKFRLYRRFEVDIWGKRLTDWRTDKKIFRLFNSWKIRRGWFRRLKHMRYVYRIDLNKSFAFKKRQKAVFVAYRASRLFYLTLSYLQFRHLVERSSNSEGSWEGSFIMLVENRLIGLLYRMQINMNIFELRWIVYRRKVYVDNKIVDYVNAAVPYFTVVRFNNIDAEFFIESIMERFCRRLMFFNTPRYLCVCYSLLFAFAFAEPTRRDLAFPVKFVDVYRSMDYY